MAIDSSNDNLNITDLIIFKRDKNKFQNIQLTLSLSFLFITLLYLTYLILQNNGSQLLNILAIAMALMLSISMGMVITLYEISNRNSIKNEYDFSIVILIIFSAGILAFNEMSKIDSQYGLVSIFYSILVVFEFINIMISFNSNR